MDIVKGYMDLLSQEYELLGRLVEFARAKRVAILDGQAESIARISDQEDETMKMLLDIRDRRQTMVRQSKEISSRRARRLALRYALEDLASPVDRPVLGNSISDYETRLRELRRASRVNSILLSDRLMVLHRTVETVLTSVSPKEEYEPGAPAGKRRRTARPGDPLVLDEKV